MFWREIVFIVFRTNAYCIIIFINSVISDRFLKHKNHLTGFKCLLSTGHNPTDEQISSLKKILIFMKKNMQQISFSVAKAEFELWYEKFKNCGYTLPLNAIDGI